MPDKRREPRFPVLVPLRVLDMGTGEPIGELANLSRHGMMLLSRYLIQPNQILQVEIALPSDGKLPERINLGIESLWYEEDDDADQYWIGFQIIDLAPENTQLLETLIAEFC